MESVENSKITCLNCNYEVSESLNFCPNCGQRLHLPRITFRDIIQDFLSSAINWDAPFVKTIAGLFKAPGETVRAILQGKRKQFYAPIRFLLLCMVLHLAFTTIIGFDPIENQKALNEGRSVTAQEQYGYQVGRFLSKHLNYFVLIFPFVIAFFSKLFYWKSPFNLAERTVFGFYLSGQYVLISFLPIALTFISPKFIYLVYLINLMYLAYAVFQFHTSESKILSLFKSILVSVLSLFTYFALAAMISWFIMLQFNLFK
tara:strand:+ start:1050 stop:1826 length:777 start_codon:yes stop_codon:yes gene_type:complete